MRDAESGLTLVEVVIMATVLLMGFAASQSLIGAITRQNTDSREYGVATLLAQERMEALKLQGFTSLKDTGPIDGVDGPFDANGARVPTGRYTVQWDIQDNVPVAGVKRLRVDVLWTTLENRSKKLSLDTVLSHVSP
jgi:Tfp pilus assembly protein PilV